jgi:hypothetical protein
MNKKEGTLLNKKGILKLAADLIANKKLYDQEQFVAVEACGTFACMAGFCYARQVGPRAFKKAIKTIAFDEDGFLNPEFAKTCAEAGVSQIGLPPIIGRVENFRVPPIFNNTGWWPEDLMEEYESNGPTWKVIAALKGLQRMLPDGKIDLDPDAVHTKIPQLKVLLAAEAKKKAKKTKKLQPVAT